jgi:hypothetical protein
VNGLLEVGLDLPVLVADDDFLEYLREQGFENTIEQDELYIEYADWAKENVEPWPPSGS